MKKIKIYLETSAICNLYQLNKPKEMADMKALWELLKQGEYDVVISSTVTKEIMDIKDKAKLDLIIDYLAQIDIERFNLTDEAHSIAQMIIKHEILTENSYDDCTHIASAMITGCDCIISYNFRHLVNIRVIKNIRKISFIHGFGDMDIMTAEALLQKGDEE